MPRPIIFGEIENIPEGYWFQGRKEIMHNSFHRNCTAGIDRNGIKGVSTIVLSGGYEDDEETGYELVKTGAGVNDRNTVKQIEDQS